MLMLIRSHLCKEMRLSGRRRQQYDYPPNTSALVRFGCELSFAIYSSWVICVWAAEKRIRAEYAMRTLLSASQAKKGDFYAL